MEYSTPPQYGAPGAPMPPGPGGQGPAAQPPSMGRRGKKTKSSDGKPVTKRVMDRQIKFAGVFAVLAALVVGLVLFGGSKPSTYVVVAKSAIAAGSTVDVDSQLQAVPVPPEFIQPDAIRAGTPKAALDLARSDVANLRAQYPIAPQQQVTKDLFNFEINLAQPLTSDERLVSVQASVANAVAGKIVPGDHVDIVATAGDVSGLVLTDVPVVSVTVSENQYQAVAEQQTGDAKNVKPDQLLPGTPVPGIYVLRVKATDAAKLVTVNAGGQLSMVYRPAEAGASPASGPMTAAGIICETSPSAAGC